MYIMVQQKKLALRKNVICDKCEGRGGKRSGRMSPNCRSTGMQMIIHQIGPGMVQQIQSVCMECRGQGSGSVLKIDVKAATEGR